MTEAAAPLAPARRRRWPWVLLIASLALNALLVGVVARSLWGLRANFAMTGGAIEASLPAFVNTLPAERREELRRLGGPDRPGMLRPLRQELRRARADAVRAFLAEPYDKAALIAAQARLLEAETRLRTAIQRQLPEIGERMTAAERRAFLSWRGHGFGPGGFRRGMGQSPRGPGLDGERGDDPAPGPGPGPRRP